VAAADPLAPVASPVDLADPQLRADPYPTWRRLRRHDPVHRTAQGPWLVTRYDDCAALIRDHRLSSDSRRVNAPSEIEESDVMGRLSVRPSVFYDVPNEDAPSRPFLFMDPPEHDRMRKLASPPFRPAALGVLDSTIDARARASVAACLERDRFDVVSDIAYPLPVSVICDVLGVPDYARPMIDSAAGDVGAVIDAPGLHTFEERERTRRGLMNALITMASLASMRSTDPGDDLVSYLVAQGCPLEDIVSTTTLLLVAGHETTVNLIANSTLALMKNQDQLDELSRQPERCEHAIDEFLRYDPPVQLIARVALERIEIRGRTIEAGDQLLLCLGSANRDGSRFIDPDRLDLTRSDAKGNLAFGSGLHYCLGAPLARIEATAVLRHLVPHLRQLAIAEEPRWRPVSSLRSLASLVLA
jgi:hypothetical protein